MYSKRELLNWLWKLGDGEGSPPSQTDLGECEDAPAPGTYHYRFESWEAALQQAGFSAIASNQKRDADGGKASEYSDAELLRCLQETAENLGHSPMFREWMELEGVPSASTFARRFGSWNEALSCAGLEPGREITIDTKYSEGELLQHIRDMRNSLGRPPSQTDLSDFDGLSSYPYMLRFGFWARAKEIALSSEGNERK